MPVGCHEADLSALAVDALGRQLEAECQVARLVRAYPCPVEGKGPHRALRRLDGDLTLGVGLEEHPVELDTLNGERVVAAICPEVVGGLALNLELADLLALIGRKLEALERRSKALLKRLDRLAEAIIHAMQLLAHAL